MSIEPTTPPIRVEIDLNKHLARFHGIDPETGHEISGPETVESMICERAAQIVAARVVADSDQYPTIREATKKLIGEKVEERVAAAVDRVFTEARTPTDTWGNPKGDPTTLAEQVEAKVEAILSKHHNADRYNRGEDSGTIVDKVIAAQVKAQVEKQVTAAVREARDKVIAQVSDVAGREIAKAVKEALR